MAARRCRLRNQVQSHSSDGDLSIARSQAASFAGFEHFSRMVGSNVEFRETLRASIGTRHEAQFGVRQRQHVLNAVLAYLARSMVACAILLELRVLRRMTAETKRPDALFGPSDARRPDDSVADDV